MLKIISKITIRIRERTKSRNDAPAFNAGNFYFGLLTFVLFGIICFSLNSSANFNGLNNSQVIFFNPFFNNSEGLSKDGLFFSQNSRLSLETPDLKVLQDNTISGISTPQVLSPKVLGDVFGGDSQSRKDIAEYNVQPGDTLQSIAQNYGVSVNTLLWANDLNSSSTIKVGQTLVILPVDGVLHVVRSGDTISEIASKYKAKSDDVVVFNDLTSENDIYIGDILIVPGGAMPKKAAPLINIQAPLADNFFIFPTQGRITQGFHFYNAVDIANKCGTPIYAAAAGVAQRVKYGYNFGGGNQVTILHSGGIVTYYGHLMTIFVKPGDTVNVGDRIALMGGGAGMAGAGRSTGCHLHFQVMGAKNPLVKYPVGSTINMK